MKLQLMDNYLSKLSQEQERAVTLTEGPVMCIAGPGSGKTTTIVAKLRYMLDFKHLSPSSILVVTFTREAAANMKNRFLSNSDSSYTKISFGTFHSIFYNMLKKESGFSNFSIIDESTIIKILYTLLQGRNNILASNNDLLKELAGDISRFKSQLIPITEYNPSILSREQFISLYNDYSAYLLEHMLLDFEDLQNKTYELLVKNKAFLKFWQSKFQYILIDEFQDINPIQFNIIRLLALPQNNLFIVGDDDQSIYSFRGARPSIMKDFRSFYPDGKVFYLSTNYRSQANITISSLRLIKNNKERYPKELTCHNKASRPVELKAFKDNREEYDFIVTSIKSHQLAGGDPTSIALLFRTNAELSKMASYLYYKGLPARTKIEVPSLWDNAYIEALLAIIEFSTGERSRGLFLKFYNKPVRYITRASLREETVDLEALEKDYLGEGKQYVAKNIKKLRKQLAFLAKLPPSLSIRFIRKEMDFDKYLKEASDLDERGLEEILERLSYLEEAAGSLKTNKQLIDYIKNYKTSGPAALPAVNLLTYHGCKGLEFETVYMPNCIEGITPWKMAKSEEATEEERRMFYVAMTRAINRLVITYSKRNLSHDTPVSRFVEEIES